MSTFGFRGASSLPRGCNIICLISTVLSASLNMMSCSIHVTSEDLSKSFPQLESKSGSYNTPSKTTLHCPIWNGSTWSKFLKDLFCCGSSSSFVSSFFLVALPKLHHPCPFGWLPNRAESRPQHNIPKNGEPGTSIFQFPRPAAQFKW